MEREKISRKRRGIAVLTLAALFFWYLPQIQVSRQIRKEQEEAVEMYVREEKEENKEIFSCAAELKTGLENQENLAAAAKKH